VLFYHDVPRTLAEQAMLRGRRQSSTPGATPWLLEALPNVPTRFVLCNEDRLLPADYLRRVVAARLRIVPRRHRGWALRGIESPQGVGGAVERVYNGLATQHRSWNDDSTRVLLSGSANSMLHQGVLQPSSRPSEQPRRLLRSVRPPTRRRSLSR
jgi:hypothetical protein